MNVWNRLFTAVRGGLNELGETIADSQALRILDQEIRDTAEQIRHWKDELGEMTARQIVAQQQVAAGREQITQYEGYAAKALDAGDLALGRDVAARIAALEDDVAGQDVQAGLLQTRIDEMRAVIAQGENLLRRLRHQVDTVRATQSVQAAQMAVAERLQGTSGRVQTALDALERLRQKQSLDTARAQAQTQVERHAPDADDLDARLREAGILETPSRTDEVLERIRHKRPHAD